MLFWSACTHLWGAVETFWRLGRLPALNGAVWCLGRLAPCPAWVPEEFVGVACVLADHLDSDHRLCPTLGRPVTMAAVMQPHMPAVAREEGQVVATGPVQVLDPQIPGH